MNTILGDFFTSTTHWNSVMHLALVLVIGTSAYNRKKIDFKLLAKLKFSPHTNTGVTKVVTNFFRELTGVMVVVDVVDVLVVVVQVVVLVVIVVDEDVSAVKKSKRVSRAN
jgi:hypothetical protein